MFKMVCPCERKQTLMTSAGRVRWLILRLILRFILYDIKMIDMPQTLWYLFVPKPVWNMVNALSCLLVRFILLLRPRKETLFKDIKRNHGRSAIKDIFRLILNNGE